MPVEAPPGFEEALVDLQNALPAWWRSRDPQSTLYKLLWVFGQELDRLAWVWEDTYRDQTLETASREGLIANFAFAWGLVSEEDALGENGLRAYIQARSKENGSLSTLENVLLAIVLAEPQNTKGGPLQQFPAGGEGIEFPANGEGIQLFEFKEGEGPSSGLQFPADSEGLRFPDSTLMDAYEGRALAKTEAAPPGGPEIGLRFTESRYVQINQNTPGPNEMEVLVLNYLAFNRPAFRRAVERFTPADCYTPVIREVTAI